MTQVIVVDGKVKAEGMEFGITDVKVVDYGRTTFGKVLMGPAWICFVWGFAGLVLAAVGLSSNVIAESLGTAFGALIILLVAGGFASWGALIKASLATH